VKVFTLDQTIQVSDRDATRRRTEIIKKIQSDVDIKVVKPYTAMVIRGDLPTVVGVQQMRLRQQGQGMRW
jgi:hypothetical protein